MPKSISHDLIGVGLRPTHYPWLESHPETHTNWFEIISENFMNSEGRPLEVLLQMREKFPIGMHGVSLSIGSSEEVSIDYLKRLKALIQKVDPILITDHFCWSQVPGENSHDLLPIPFTKEAINRVIDNVDKVQNFIGRPIALENISYYITYKCDEMSEDQFITEVCQKSGCGLLLDVNNVYVNSVNHRFDPYQFIDRLPLNSVRQIHIAGPSEEPGFLFDTHSTPAPDRVWELLKHVLSKKVKVPIIFEWDQDIPEFSILDSEVLKAKQLIVEVEK